MFIFNWILKLIKRINPPFLISILALQGMGLLALYSATQGAYSSNSFLFKYQIIWMALGWVAFFIIYSIHYLLLRRIAWFLYVLHLIFLISIFLFEREAHSIKRWLDLKLFYYQPSEMIKFILIILVSDYLSKESFRKPLGWIKVIQITSILIAPIILILMQPDLGTTGVILLIIATLVFFQGIEKKVLFSSILICIVSIPFVWNFGLKSYQKNRIISFINPKKDPKGIGYNVIQSKIAIGSGEMFGKGFLKGTQNHLQFLPERHTDFIFSVWSEEYGFLGNLGTLFLFIFLILFSIQSAMTSRNRIECFLCLGIGSFLFWHSFLNLSMTMGLFPVVGIPLPLLSYGGSHTVTTMTVLGTLASINKRKVLF